MRKCFCVYIGGWVVPGSIDNEFPGLISVGGGWDGW